MKVFSTEEYRSWLADLKDRKAKARILVRSDRMKTGNLGDVKQLGDGISEARVDYGPGYRIYFAQRHGALLLLVLGGTKSRQQADIEKAKRILRKKDEERWWELDQGMGLR